MAQRPTVRWNEGKQRWMAWVRFPDGSRRKVERTDKTAAQIDLDALLTLRAHEIDPEPPRKRMATFAEIIEAWFADGCPNVAPSPTSRHARVKSPNTIANAHQLLCTSVIPAIGSLKVDRTTTQRLEELFESMVATHATSTIDRNWNYLNQALQHAQAEPDGQDEPGHRRVVAGAAAVQGTQELHPRTDPTTDHRRNPCRPPTRHVAHRPDVRAATR